MNSAIQDSEVQRFDCDRLDLLVGRFLRILHACGVREEDVIESVQRVASAGSEEAMPEAIDAPADLHLACTDIVFLWRRSPTFLDSLGRPKRLEARGSECSFEELASRAAPHFDSAQTLAYLERLGAVSRDTSGLLSLSVESVVACSLDASNAISSSTVLTHIQAFLSSVEYNVLDRHDGKSPRFERACYGKIPDRLVPILERLIEVRGQNFIDSVDEWLARHATNEEGGKEVWLAGAGAYVFAHPSNIFEENR
jgi:hypothetical protein